MAPQPQPSEFDEKNLATLIEFYLARSHFHAYGPEVIQITQRLERGAGFDAVVTTLVPFYCQFKRASFYPPGCNSNLAETRASVGFDDRSGFYAMSLHRHHKSRSSEQQNNLYELSKRFKTAYVAPKFYRANVFRRLKNEYRDFGYPWRYEALVLTEERYSMVPFDRIRMFHGLISIPPHKYVEDTNAHHYTYNSQHQVCFHSDPEPLFDGGGQSFVGFLQNVSEAAMEGHTPQQIAKVQAGLLPELFQVSERSPRLGAIVEHSIQRVLDPGYERWQGGLAAFKDLEPMEAIWVFGDILSEHLGINQYLMAMSSDWRDFRQG